MKYMTSGQDLIGLVNKHIYNFLKNKMKTPFSLEEYRQHPDWKIETRDGRSVEIVYTDRISERPIIAVINGTDALYYYANGRGNGSGGWDSEDDLFFVTDDEPSAFEKKLAQIIRSRDGDCSYADEKATPEEIAHYQSKELLELAKKELFHEDDDEIIEAALYKYFSKESMPYNELCDIVPRLTTDKVLNYLKKKLKI